MTFVRDVRRSILRFRSKELLLLQQPNKALAARAGAEEAGAVGAEEHAPQLALQVVPCDLGRRVSPV